MIDHPYVQHPVWPRDQCEHRLDEEKDGAYGICGAPRSEHMDEVRVLKVQLATALRERDIEREFRGAAEAAFAEQLARTEAAESALAVANARADEYRTNWVSEEARRIKADEALAAARRESTLYRGVIGNLLNVMEMQEKRESGAFHITGEVMWGIWSDAKSQASEALAAPAAAAGEERTR